MCGILENRRIDIKCGGKKVAWIYFAESIKRRFLMMEHTLSNVKTITRKHTIKVVTQNTPKEIINTEKILSNQDEEMDKRASHAVKSAIERAIICKKPIAKYD